MSGDDERGVGTVLTAGVAMVLVVAATAASILATWLAQVTATQDAADLAALAGASAMAEGFDGCAAADVAADANQATLMECDVRGDERAFVLEVSVRAVLQPRLPGLPEEVVRTATAGTG
ncbi:hypothetical protein FOJ82_05235 [Tessaracoccus rhinocerotis]|uniref:Flp pilus-assembly TadE/G-like family protein n=1 Tax=Tessaracoccus rhinocerotis TaxID=1689449 RepID=A0A553K1H4_9ACTN|nr:Rv3654c family TadE-like protein [Tessaracoccus rhinocerotis]TRY18535.1 hypothetical protein FOJ82_05235 [Tessaracoccus rhinocerotis]